MHAATVSDVSACCPVEKPDELRVEAAADGTPAGVGTSLENAGGDEAPAAAPSAAGESSGPAVVALSFSTTVDSSAPTWLVKVFAE
jgi:hypothetical protein